MLKRNHPSLVTTCLLLILLTACVVHQPVAPQAVAPPQSPATQPAAIPAAPQPAPTGTPKEGSSSVAARINQSPVCSPAQLGESVILNQWQRDAVGNVFTPVDPLSGAPLCGFQPVKAGKDTTYAFSPDGKQLAFIFTRYDDHRDGFLHLVDLENWVDFPTQVEIKDWVVALVFSPDGAQLAVVYGNSVTDDRFPTDFPLIIYDLKAQAVRAQTSLDLAPRQMQYTPDSRALMIYGVSYQDSDGLNSEPRALLLDANSLEPTWETAVAEVTDGQTRLYGEGEAELYAWWGPAAVVSAEKQAVYIVHAEDDQLTTVDFASRTVATVAIHPPMGWLERLLVFGAGRAYAKEMNGTTKQAALSPDGERLYVIAHTNDSHQDENGEWTFDQTFHGLQVVDVATGAEIAHLDSQATDLALSQDGRSLYLTGWKDNSVWSDVVDLENLEMKQHLTRRNLIPADRLDGSPLLLSSFSLDGSQTTLATFDPASLAEIKTWWVWGQAHWVIQTDN